VISEQSFSEVFRRLSWRGNKLKILKAVNPDELKTLKTKSKILIVFPIFNLISSTNLRGQEFSKHDL